VIKGWLLPWQHQSHDHDRKGAARALPHAIGGHTGSIMAGE
jgi:hypothetical protein